MGLFLTKKITIARTLILAVLLGLLLSVLFLDLPGEDDDAATGQDDDRSSSSGAGGTAVDLERRVIDFTSGLGPSDGYRPPRRAEREAVAEGVGLLLDGRSRDARQRLADADFAVEVLVDRPTGRRFAELADPAREREARRGWGRVYVALDGPARWSAQVPHPVADRSTERLGVGVLRGSPGGVLVLAGAHRTAGEGDAADVAHRRDTVFHAVCAHLVARGLPGLQVHGFARDSAPGRDVIASTGAGHHARAEGRVLADALRHRGYEVCRAWARSCPLAGRTNMQGRGAADAGVPFLHVEFDPDLRTPGRRARDAVAAMSEVTGVWSRTDGRREQER